MQVESLHNTHMLIKGNVNSKISGKEKLHKPRTYKPTAAEFASKTWQIAPARSRGLSSIWCLFILPHTLALSAECIQPLNIKSQCMPAPFLIAASLFKLQALSSKHLVSYYTTKHPPLCWCSNKDRQDNSISKGWLRKAITHLQGLIQSLSGRWIVLQI